MTIGLNSGIAARRLGAAAFMIAAGALGSPASAQMWQQALGTPEEERSEWIWENQDGNYGVCGFRQPGYGYALEMDSNGNLLWDGLYDGPGSFDIFNRIQETADGGWVCAGETSGIPGAAFGISLTKLDSSGNVLWSYAYPGTAFAGGTPGGVGLDETPDGGFVICGRLQGIPDAQQAPILIRTNSLGQVLWIRYYIDTRYGPNTYASFNDVHAIINVDGTRGFIASGFTAPSVTGDRDSLLMKLDDLGNVIFGNTYGHVGFTDAGYGCDPADNDDFLMSGFAKIAGEGGGTYLMRTDNNGNLLWHQIYRFFGGTSSMEETPSGRIVLAGNVNDFAGVDEASIMVTDPVGNISWCQAYTSGTQKFGEAVTPTQDGGYHLISWASGLPFGLFDLYSVKTDAVGVSGCNEFPFSPLQLLEVPPVVEVQWEIRERQGFADLPMERLEGTFVEPLCDPAPECVEPPDCMAAWWTFDAMVAGTFSELIHGNTATATAIGVNPLAGEYVDNSVCFDGTGYNEVPDDPALDFGEDDFSIDFWIRPDFNAGTVSVLDKRAGSVGWHVYLFNNQVGIQIADGAFMNWTNPGALPVGEWTFVAITVDRDDPNGIRFYINGALENTYNPTAYAGSLDNGSVLRMGVRSIALSGFYRGCLDELELFNRQLTAAEVASLYIADTAGKCKDICLADLDGDGIVGFPDLIAILSSWGPCTDPCCPQDLNGDGVIGFGDLIAILSAWGPCP